MMRTQYSIQGTNDWADNLEELFSDNVRVRGMSWLGDRLAQVTLCRASGSVVGTAMVLVNTSYDDEDV